VVVHREADDTRCHSEEPAVTTDRDDEDLVIWRLEECGLRAVGSPEVGYHILDPFGGLVAVAPDLPALRRLADAHFAERWTRVRRVRAA
jgi:hypothetical protein